MSYKDFRPRLRGNKKAAFENLTKKERRILVIGDLHAPFTLDGYLDFCIDMYAIYNCNQVIFIGDIIDNHYASFHTTDPDGLGGGDELELAVEDVAKWYDAFPVADVTIGNHDRFWGIVSEEQPHGEALFEEYVGPTYYSFEKKALTNSYGTRFVPMPCWNLKEMIRRNWI